jgi:aminoacrylate hydrolase
MPYAPIRDGQLYYEEHGAGPPLLLVAGLGGVGAYWRPQLATFRQRFRVIVHDHRGCGQSTRSEIDYSIDQMAEDVLALMDHLGLKRAHLLGHSTGGAIGQTIAITRPDRLASLILYATWTRVDIFMGRIMKARKTLLEAAGADAFIELTPCLLFPDWWLNQNPDKLAALDRMTREGFPSVSIAASRCQAVIDFDRTRELDSIVAPTLVLGVHDDFLTPFYFSTELARRIRGAELAAIERGGHCASQVDPPTFEKPVLELLQRQ